MFVSKKVFIALLCVLLIFSSCSKKEEKKSCDSQELKTERTDGTELYVSSDHCMTKEDYISFICYATSDSILLRKLYPEWGISFNFPWLGHGKILWYSEKEGLKYRLV